MDSIKICFIGPEGSIHLIRWLTALSEREHQVSYIGIENPNIKNVTFISLPKISVSWIRWIVHVFLIRKHLKRIQPDILHAHYISTYGYYAMFSATCPWVLTAWGSDIYVHAKKVKHRYLTRRAIKKSSYITGDSRDLIESIQRIEKKSPPSDVINFGVDLTKFKPATEIEKKQLRVKYQLEESDIVVLNFRRWDRHMGVLEFLDAFELSVAKNKNLKCLLAGYGSYANQIKEKIYQSKYKDRILCPGQVDHQKLIDIIQLSDMMVSVPLTDATSVSLLESMACGLPIIATQLKSTMEWIQQDHNGILIHPIDVVQLSKALIDLAENKELRVKMGNLNRIIVQERADHNIMIQRMETVYQNLINFN